ncbi:unnamed protein product [Angiostrongylus costaricensis]|uniref:RRM domain-containing protein n=1 Tax=Angiostrongylus costaricensis TaxID=334426 RepID=A0A0R3Q2V1_ANGCS|nr:unnamed protein product [Angiostrongylus costaricensis]
MCGYHDFQTASEESLKVATANRLEGSDARFGKSPRTMCGSRHFQTASEAHRMLESANHVERCADVGISGSHKVRLRGSVREITSEERDSHWQITSNDVGYHDFETASEESLKVATANRLEGSDARVGKSPRTMCGYRHFQTASQARRMLESANHVERWADIGISRLHQTRLRGSAREITSEERDSHWQITSNDVGYHDFETASEESLKVATANRLEGSDARVGKSPRMMGGYRHFQIASEAHRMLESANHVERWADIGISRSHQRRIGCSNRQITSNGGRITAFPDRIRCVSEGRYGKSPRKNGDSNWQIASNDVRMSGFPYRSGHVSQGGCGTAWQITSNDVRISALSDRIRGASDARIGEPRGTMCGCRHFRIA